MVEVLAERGPWVVQRTARREDDSTVIIKVLRADEHRPEDVARGANILLSAPEGIQKAWPPDVRLRLLRLALDAD